MCAVGINELSKASGVGAQLPATSTSPSAAAPSAATTSPSAAAPTAATTSPSTAPSAAVEGAVPLVGVLERALVEGLWHEHDVLVDGGVVLDDGRGRDHDGGQGETD